MIPLKIQLKNFLSYGPTLQTIDFGPYPLICLSGKNGHGKSALLDAITWAIWGQARKISGVAKADNHLLRLGQTQMMVILDFMFNGNVYRIRREFAKTYGKPYAALDFGILDDTGHQSTALTGKTIRETQTTIETTLGLDFDSFINTAFLRQGQSNEFSKKSPKDRKEILSTILGLKHYEVMKKLALDKTKEAAYKLQQLQAFHHTIQQELEKKDALKNNIAAIVDIFAQLTLKEKKMHAQHQELETRKRRCAQRQEQKKLLIQQHHQISHEQQELHKKLLSTYHAWKNIHRQQRSLPDTAALERQHKELLEKNSLFQQQFQKNLELKADILRIQEEQQLIKNTHDHEFRQKMNDVQTKLFMHQAQGAAKKAEEKALHSQITAFHEARARAQDKMRALEKELHALGEHDTSAQEKQFEKRKTIYHQWSAQGNMIAKELLNIQQKMHLQHDDTTTSCPLCEQNLSASRKKFLKTKYLLEEKFYKNRLARLSSCTKSLKQLLLEQHALLEDAKNKNLLRSQFNAHVEELKKNEHEASAQQQQIEHALVILKKEVETREHDIRMLQEELHTHQKSEHLYLTANERYTALIEQLARAHEQVKNSLYHQENHQKIVHALQDIERQKQEMAHFLQEIAQQQKRKDDVHALCKTLKELKKALQKLDRDMLLFNDLEQEQDAIDHDARVLDHETRELQTLKEKTLVDKGKLEQEQATLELLEKKRVLQEHELRVLQEEIDDYQLLATTLGKDGIQALLIEEALPEIEQEANELLGQLTNNQSHIMIESLRDLQKGGTKETLDIKISDAQGIRPYELFSGGEAFRIDFALRIAISKLLARRAGTSLQTLIIDEGFGSQDEEGLSYIMDALHKIQNNFCKIIIVSHLTSMKDQFPVHFMIEKGAQGSTVQVMEQG